jgi:hypothetical protein
MPKLPFILIIMMSLSGCEGTTINGINPAQEESTFCGRNLGLCIVGGAVAIGGIASVATSGYHKKSGVTYPTTGGTTGGTTTTGGGTYP